MLVSVSLLAPWKITDVKVIIEYILASIELLIWQYFLPGSVTGWQVLAVFICVPRGEKEIYCQQDNLLLFPFLGLTAFGSSNDTMHLHVSRR